MSSGARGVLKPGDGRCATSSVSGLPAGASSASKVATTCLHTSPRRPIGQVQKASLVETWTSYDSVPSTTATIWSGALRTIWTRPSAAYASPRRRDPASASRSHSERVTPPSDHTDDWSVFHRRIDGDGQTQAESSLVSPCPRLGNVAVLVPVAGSFSTSSTWCLCRLRNYVRMVTRRGDTDSWGLGGAIRYVEWSPTSPGALPSTREMSVVDVRRCPWVSSRRLHTRCWPAPTRSRRL